ncbi:hypothetical protein MELA_02788 [Candidatus Methylomirabilis lanthanidiphila]|uniref:Uncharacterized protein n=1 Tax=Candidatus Methylomirabilis lanthanidiphila TaxID=2211376 RepID=A0A564ZM30_9BACT|nr:hypothetical protein MELA_02788 [Candidatus Methylomirabilis lanthanidiphila]
MKGAGDVHGCRRSMNLRVSFTGRQPVNDAGHVFQMGYVYQKALECNYGKKFIAPHKIVC